jgi:hypothetical protein
MADFHPQCPKCSKLMERGYVPDVSHSQVYQGSWARGIPEQRRFVGGIKHKQSDTIPVDAYRCPSCGYVEFYARPA